jgi:hypothetical protein
VGQAWGVWWVWRWPLQLPSPTHPGDLPVGQGPQALARPLWPQSFPLICPCVGGAVLERLSQCCLARGGVNEGHPASPAPTCYLVRVGCVCAPERSTALGQVPA